MEGLVFGVGKGTYSFVFCMSKEKFGFLAQKDANADHLVTLHSFPLQNKIKESYRSVGGQGNQSPLPSPKPPHHACIQPSLELTYFSCKYVYQGTMLPAQGKHFTRAFIIQSQALPNDIDRQKYTIFSNSFWKTRSAGPIYLSLSVFHLLSSFLSKEIIHLKIKQMTCWNPDCSSTACSQFHIYSCL